jgi:hypothetical protein
MLYTKFPYLLSLLITFPIGQWPATPRSEAAPARAVAPATPGREAAGNAASSFQSGPGEFERPVAGTNDMQPEA